MVAKPGVVYTGIRVVYNAENLGLSPHKHVFSTTVSTATSHKSEPLELLELSVRSCVTCCAELMAARSAAMRAGAPG